VELYFLGTGAGMPSKERNVTSLVLNLMAERNAIWMFDCGEATQHQVLRAPVRIGKLERLFVTHLHGDHLYGLPGLLTSRSYQGGDTPFTLHGPVGLKRFIHTALEVSQAHLAYPLEIEEFEPDFEGVVFEDEQFRVTTAPLVHRIDSHGYRIEEKPQKGRLQAERLKELGIASGPLYGKIKRGEDVVLEDGTVLRAADFVGPSIRGRTVTILGDTQPCPGSLMLSRGADVLVHEATFMENRKELAVKYDHSTAADAAKTAREAGAGVLILTHISSRYQGEETERLLAEAKAIHGNTLLAYDHFRFELAAPGRGGGGA